MSKEFRLHAHEVWREKLIRSGPYQDAVDLSEFAGDEWEDGHFVWCCYSALRGENEQFGQLMFRPRNGSAEENFFVSGKIRHGSEQEYHCKPFEFAFGDGNTACRELEYALLGNAWGRVFYLNDELQLRCTDMMSPCDWGLFIASNGLGLWKWATLDGASWNKASLDGVFRWGEDSAKTTKFLARSTSLQVWERLTAQLEDENSEMSFAWRWLQMEYGGKERFDIALDWSLGSREECEWVLTQLLLTTPETQDAEEAALWFPLEDHEDEEGERFSLSLDQSYVEMPSRLQISLTRVRDYFGVHLNEALPLCVQMPLSELALVVSIKSSTAHERFEAYLQLKEWCGERGLVL